MPVSHPFPGVSAHAHQRTSGFTAIELMVTVAILAVLSTLAAPSFSGITERWRVRQAAEDLESSIYFARSEGIKRGGNVTLAANGSGWNEGWTVSAGAETLQQSTAPARTSVAVTGGGTAQTSLNVNRWGMLTTDSDTAVPVVVLVTPTGKDGTSPSATLLCVGTGGRIAHKSGASQTCP